jgi:hypothetical protein
MQMRRKQTVASIPWMLKRKRIDEVSFTYEGPAHDRAANHHYQERRYVTPQRRTDSPRSNFNHSTEEERR